MFKRPVIRSEQTWAAALGLISSIGAALGLQSSFGAITAWSIGGAGIIVSIALAVHSEAKERAKESRVNAERVDLSSGEKERASGASEVELVTPIDGVEVAEPALRPINEEISSGVDADADVAHDGAYARPQDSTVFFSDRFAQAFPGVRGIRWFRQPEALERLSLLLKQPLTFQLDDHTWSTLIWYWGRGDMEIRSFVVEEADMALLDIHELRIDEIGAVNPGSYYQQFVYIKTLPSTPSAFYNGDIDGQLSWRGYADEELGLYKGRYISREEYDDGAAVIDGKPVDVRGEVRLRKRYLTPFNFLIAAQFSPLNNVKADREVTALLNGILRGDRTLEDLTALVCALPKRSPLSYDG